MLLGTLEAGGTKMVMGLADEKGRIIRSASCKTRLPEETLPDILAFFKGQPLDALGVATFGPVDLDPQSRGYGSITNTPKLAWRDFPLLSRLKEALRVPCAIDTDVNGAVLAEARLGAARGLRNVLYFTVGTGIGGGLMAEGQLVHGLIHPEWGHTIVSRHPQDPLTRGVCPYHENCTEGFAAGPAMLARWAMPEMEAFYLAQLCVNALMTVSPQRILLGGGIMHHLDLYPMVRRHVTALLGGYLSSPALHDMDSFIMPPALYPDSGLVGGALLALQAVR
jgi:fructokinase